MEKLLTIAEIAHQLGIPESTARYYRDKFADYIPSVGQGRQKRYRPEAVEVLKVIADGLRNNRTAIEVAEQLTHDFSKTIDVQSLPQPVTATAQQQQDQALVAEVLRIRAHYDERINQLEQMVITSNEVAIAAREEAMEARQYISASLDERDRRLMELIRSQQKLKKPWWKFWN